MFTPLEIEALNFKKAPMGYSCVEVDKIFEDIIKDYETLYKENIELKEKMNTLNENISYYKSLENTLQSTLVLAEKAADETKAAARATAESIKKDAELSASELINSYNQQINELTYKIDFLKNQFETTKIKIKQLLVSELEIVLNTDINDTYKNQDINLVIDQNQLN